MKPGCAAETEEINHEGKFCRARSDPLRLAGVNERNGRAGGDKRSGHRSQVTCRRVQESPNYRGRRAAPTSSLDADLYVALRKVAAKRCSNSTLLQTVLTATTDAVSWREHGIPAYGISPNPVLPEQESGDDECLAIGAPGPTVSYVYNVLSAVAAKK